MRKNILTILLFTASVSSIDAQSWSLLESGIGTYNNDHVDAFETYNGELYVGGSFYSAGNILANGIAKWNGTSWSAVGSGIVGEVYSLCVFNGELYAGGYISSAGNIPVLGLARWNGTSWSAVGNIATSDVKAMTVFNGELYVAGEFPGFFANGTSIVKWDGSNWAAVVPENDLYHASIESMVVYNGNLYAAGAYYEIGGGGVPDYFRITKWDGFNWSILLTIPATYTLDGAIGNISSMTVYDNELYIGGSFAMTIDSIPTYHIAKWNGTNWSAVGSGINPAGYPFGGGSDGSGYSFVNSIEVYNGALYAGGRFYGCGSIATGNIAKWDGTNWSALGQGVSGFVYSMHTSGTSLYVGGWFEYVDSNLPANRVAKWGTSCSPAQPGIINGSNNVCKNSLQTYSIDAVAGATSYTWSLPSGWAGNSTTNSITLTTGTSGGIMSVIANNACGSTFAQTLIVAVTSIPQQPLSINGNDTVCDRTTLIYSIDSVANAQNYTWDLPAGWSGFSNSNSITVESGLDGGSISVVANNNCGASIPQTILVTTETVPGTPALINGNDTVCEGSSQTYFIDPVPGATAYAWDLTFGSGGISNTDSITIVVDHHGYLDDLISVSAYNNCGNSNLQILPVIVNLLPEYPNGIIGNTVVCRGSVQTYFTNPVYNTTSYTWTLPTGWIGSSNTSSINVIAGNEPGEISVIANNSCGNGAFTSLPIRLDTILSAPGNITGNVYVNAGQSQSYSINLINGVSGYNWSLSGGGNIITGQNTSKIEVNWQTPGAYVLSANVTNSCGVSADQTITIKVSAANFEDPYSLQLFPNPSTGQFFLKAKRVQDKVINVEVLNMAGQLVFRSGKKQGANDYTQPINLDKMAAGIYAVKIMIDDKTYVRSVMIKH